MSEQPDTTNGVNPNDSTATGWRGQQVYLMAIACLILGVAVGYFVRGSQSPVVAATTTPATAVQQAHGMPGGPAQAPPTLDQMKQMADKAAAPVLEKIKTNPKDFNALNDAGKVYR